MRHFIDTHVHVYHCYEAVHILNNAAASVTDDRNNNRLVLCLTESFGFDYYREWHNRAAKQEQLDGWEVRRISGHPALEFIKNGLQIVVIAGRQVISSDRLEIIALFSDHSYQDGQPSQSIIDQIKHDRGIAVLPWGVGKWLGKRGKIVTQLLEQNTPETLAIADISSRPALWPLPRHFKDAARAGFNRLYGTDPLPLEFDQDRIGSAGIILELPDKTESALSELKTRLLTPSAEIFGKRVSTLRFTRDQLMLRMRKRACLEKSQPGHSQQ